MKRIASTLVLAAILALSCGSGSAEGTRFSWPRTDMKECRGLVYPKSALRKEEEGLVIVGIQVDESGAVLDSKILLSSGSADLDKAAQLAFTSCPHTPGTVNDRPVTMWMPMQYVWSTDPSSGKSLKALKQAALDGDLQARYALGTLVNASRRSEVEQDAGLKLVISAAEDGEPMAQISLAGMYEYGKRFPRDIAEAHRWYAKAASQGNILRSITCASWATPTERGLGKPCHHGKPGGQA